MSVLGRLAFRDATETFQWSRDGCLQFFVASSRFLASLAVAEVREVGPQYVHLAIWPAWSVMKSVDSPCFAAERERRDPSLDSGGMVLTLAAD
jgi:hypothetical protein